MPTYEHKCCNLECQYEWEDMYSIKKDPPAICPKCNQNTAQRVISGGSGKGTVELTGNELVEKIKSDANKLQKDASKNENVYSNLIGESRYQQIQTKMDQQKSIRRSK